MTDQAGALFTSPRFIATSFLRLIATPKCEEGGRERKEREERGREGGRLKEREERERSMGGRESAADLTDRPTLRATGAAAKVRLTD